MLFPVSLGAGPGGELSNYADGSTAYFNKRQQGQQRTTWTILLRLESFSDSVDGGCRRRRNINVVLCCLSCRLYIILSPRPQPRPLFRGGENCESPLPCCTACRRSPHPLRGGVLALQASFGRAGGGVCIVFPHPQSLMLLLWQAPSRVLTPPPTPPLRWEGSSFSVISVVSV